KINPKISDQSSLVLVLAQVLKDNKVETLSKVLNKCAVPSILTNQVIFLINFLDFKTEDVLKTYKQKVRFSVENDTIDKWLKINNLQDHNILKFINYSPSISAENVMIEYGIKPGPELGRKIQELELEIY